ncbi:MAG: glycosyltransferase family 39 protein [Candidatus Schekmanbacteria bacterium]|nr:glycosyltransferase family 39 protein [Candidatus Schekmanbacteria bacterium]
MMNFKRKYFLLFLLFAISLVYLSIGIDLDLGHYDEGLMVYTSARIMNGDIPYKDFFSNFPPGQLYLVALLFKIFSVTVIVERIASVIILSFLSLTVYLIADKILPRRFALLAWFISLIHIGAYGFYGNAVPSALLFVMLSVLCLFLYIDGKQRGCLLVSGAMLGMAILFRYDIGGYAFIAEFLAIFAFIHNEAEKLNGNMASGVSNTLKIVSFMPAGMMIALIPLVYFFRVVPIHDLVYDFVVFPFSIYPQSRALQYPFPIPDPSRYFSSGISLPWQFIFETISRVPFYFPFLEYVLAAFILISMVRGKKDILGKSNTWRVIILLLLGILLLNHAVVRSDEAHVFSTMMPAIIILCVLIFLIKESKRNKILFSILASLIALLIIINPLYKKSIQIRRAVFTNQNGSFELERAKGIYLRDKNESDYQDMIKFIQSNVPEGEKIFVGNYRHDKSFISDIMVYFLSNRDSATKFHDLHPGIVTTEPVQQMIIRDIEMQKVKYIVLWNNESGETSSQQSGSKILDDYIRSNFSCTGLFGEHSIWKRNM